MVLVRKGSGPIDNVWGSRGGEEGERTLSIRLMKIRLLEIQIKKKII